jgi:hypothetical protein
MACDVCAPKLIRLAEKLERLAADNDTRNAVTKLPPGWSE